MVEAVLSRVELSAARLALGRLLGHDLAVIYSLVVLALIGLVVSFSAGPVATARLGIDDPFFFTERHVVFLCGSASLAFATSLLSPTTARRLGILLAGLCVLLMVAALVIGPEIKGAHRWISFGRFNLQPSEFFKPAFVCAAAWFLSMERNDSGLNGSTAALVLYSVASILLIMQPDYGQWMLLTGIWMVMFFVAGWSWTWIFGLGTAALSALGFGYVTQAHVRSRIDRFLNPSSGDTYQVDKASEAISSGGVFGHDLHEVPGVKASLPDAHTDFVFAVAVEEFGLVIGLLIIGAFLMIALRGFSAALSTRDLFTKCVIAGLTAALTLQAAINIGVNVSLLPAKGMTLPLVSYGGSSLLATGLTVGLLLVFTRKKGS